MIKVYQIDNQKFFEKNRSSSLMYDPDYPQFNNTTVLDTFKKGAYIHVADLDVDTLDEAFEVGNIGPEDKYTRYERMRSVSVGDVLMMQDDPNIYVVAGMGFVNVGLPLI